MTDPLPAQTPASHVRGVAIDIILTFVTCGFWNLWVQHKQMQAVNDMIGEQRYAFLPWLLLSIVTCGIYHIYHEWKKSTDIAVALKDPNSSEPVVNVVLSIFGLSIIADAIQQSRINEFYGSKSV